MKRRCRQVVVGLALIGIGWAAARAQTPAPDFEIVVNAPTGQTTVQCVRGCGVGGWITP